MEFNDIQKYINNLYGYNWVQPNAFYPTILGYDDKGQCEKTSTLLKGLSDVSGKGKSIESIINDEKALKGELIPAISGAGLKTFDHPELVQKVDNINFQSLPFEKKNGVLGASKVPGDAAFINIEFGIEQNGYSFEFIKNWQNKWFTKDANGFQFKTHKDPGEGEGYLGLSYVNISTDGKMEDVMHLSLFGLIPLEISDTLSSVGPTTTPSGIPALKLKCIYSQGVLTTKDKVHFFLK